MAWPFRTASFRGVEFFVESSGQTGGRDLVEHKIPHGVGELDEDIGPEEEHFQLEAYVIAGTNFSTAAGRDDFVRRRTEELLVALGREGPGTLLHPIHGVVWARVKSYTLHESTRVQGMARFTIDFKRDRELEVTASVAQRAPGGQAEQHSVALEQAAGANVTANLGVGPVTESAREASAGELAKLGAALQKLKTAGAAAADLSRKAVSLIRDAKALATAPADLVSQVVTAVRDVERAVLDVPGALAAYQALLKLVPSVFGSAAEDHNALLVATLTRSAAAGGAMRAAVAMQWESYEQAVAAREALLAELEDVARTAPDDLYDALADYQAALVDLVPPEDEQLPRVGTFTPPATIPALPIAFRLYGDRSRDAEIIARNHVRNPNFVPGGEPLEILVDGSR